VNKASLHRPDAVMNVGISHAHNWLKNSRCREAFTILYSGYSARREKGMARYRALGNRWRTKLYSLAGKKSPSNRGLRRIMPRESHNRLEKDGQNS
jgi:hypothetical protein